jgi:hypothetical protein
VEGKFYSTKGQSLTLCWLKLSKADGKGKDDSNDLVAIFPYSFCYNGATRLNEKVLGLKKLVGIVK